MLKWYIVQGKRKVLTAIFIQQWCKSSTDAAFVHSGISSSFDLSFLIIFISWGKNSWDAHWFSRWNIFYCRLTSVPCWKVLFMETPPPARLEFIVWFLPSVSSFLFHNSCFYPRSISFNNNKFKTYLIVYTILITFRYVSKWVKFFIFGLKHSSTWGYYQMT